MHKKLSSFILLLVLITAFFLSMKTLDTRSLWLDEGITFYNSGAETIGSVTERVASLDLSPPGYYYVMHFWQEISGQNTGTFRLLSVFFCLASVYLIYLLGRAVFREEVGLIAAFLLAINPFNVGFSQEARMYMMLTFFILLAVYALLKILTQENNAKWWVVFTLANTFGLFIHNFYLFVGFALAMCLLLFLGITQRRGQTLISAFISGGITFVLYLPWLPHFMEQLKVDRYWIKALTLADFKTYFIDFAGGSLTSLYILVALIFVGLVYLFTLLKDAEGQKIFFKFSIIAFFGVLAFGFPIIYSFTTAPLSKIRYFLFIPALISLFAAVGIYSLRKIHSTIVVLPIILLFVVFQPWQVSAYPSEMNEDFRAVASYIENFGAPSIPVLIHTPSASHVFNFYSDGPIYPFPNSFDLRDYNISDKDENSFKEYVSKFDDFWLLITHSHEKPQGILRSWSEDQCPQIEEKDFGPIFLARYSCS